MGGIMSKRRRGERLNGYPNDVLAPDGVSEYGWRMVRKGGVVKFVNSDWQHDSLIPYIGQYVTVKVGCVHCVDVDVFKEYPCGCYNQNHICNIKIPETDYTERQAGSIDEYDCPECGSYNTIMGLDGMVCSSCGFQFNPEEEN